MALIDHTEDIEQRYLRMLSANVINGKGPLTREWFPAVPLGRANLIAVQAIREAWVAGLAFANTIKSPQMELKIIDIREKGDHGDTV